MCQLLCFDTPSFVFINFADFDGLGIKDQRKNHNHNLFFTQLQTILFIVTNYLFHRYALFV